VFSLACLGGILAISMSTSISEGFYLVIPPLALALHLTGVGDLRETIRRRLRPCLTLAAGLFTLSLGLAYLFLDRRLVLSWNFWIEAGSCLYFLTAALIVLLTIRRSILACARCLDERWKLSPGVRMLLCEALPLALFVFIALPYGIAFAHVHRFKMPNLADPKTALDRDFEKIEFHSADGTRLRGWWIPARTPSSRTLIICHGIAANRSIFLPFVEAGDWLDANVLMFDLRGHGESGGRTITLGYREKDDVLAAVAWVRSERSGQAKQVIGMGISLGAASLAEAAARAEPPLDAVILDSCFASTADMTRRVLSDFPRATHPWLLTLGPPLADWHAGCPMMQIRPEESLRKLRSPVLFLHSRGDPLIPSEHASRLHGNAAGPKRLCIFELPGHCDAFFAERDRYRQEVVAFVNDTCNETRER
jgi:alpha-beta hydrolase superfamily lysophospholipase